MSAIFSFPVSGWGQRLAKKRPDREEQHRAAQECAGVVQQWNEAEVADADQRHVTEDRATPRGR
jgi:hypothetical protein